MLFHALDDGWWTPFSAESILFWLGTEVVEFCKNEVQESVASATFLVTGRAVHFDGVSSCPRSAVLFRSCLSNKLALQTTSRFQTKNPGYGIWITMLMSKCFFSQDLQIIQLQVIEFCFDHMGVFVSSSPMAEGCRVDLKAQQNSWDFLLPR